MYRKSSTRLRQTAVLNVGVDKETFERIIAGTQKVVFEYFDRKSAVEKWYDKGKELVIKVWCGTRKKGNRNAKFACVCIWDTDNWSWFGWVPEEKIYDEFDEPACDHFVLYLGDRIDSPREDVRTNKRERNNQMKKGKNKQEEKVSEERQLRKVSIKRELLEDVLMMAEKYARKTPATTTVIFDPKTGEVEREVIYRKTIEDVQALLEEAKAW